MHSLSAEDLPYMKCPLHTILKLTPVAYGTSLPLNITPFYFFKCFLFIEMYSVFCSNRLQGGNVLSQCGGSEHASRPVSCKSLWIELTNHIIIFLIKASKYNNPFK